MGMSIRQYAKHRNCSDTAVRKALRDGRITLGADGKIDPEEADRQWARRTDPARQRAPSAKAGPANLPAERARLVKAQADRAELELARERGELIEREDVLAQWTQLIAAARAKLLALPTRIAPRVIGMKNVAQIEDAIRTIVYEALHELAGNGVPDEPED